MNPSYEVSDLLDYPGGRPVFFDFAHMDSQFARHEENQAGTCQLFLPDSGYARPQQTATSESTGTNSSHFSIPQRTSSFVNSMARSTSSSSYESGWSNLQAGGAVVSAEQYRSLQARFDEMSKEHSQLSKKCEILEAKNGVLKEAYEHVISKIPYYAIPPKVLKREEYPNITYWYRHEYLAALGEGRITSVDDAPVKGQHAENNEAEDAEDEDGEEGLQDPSSRSAKSKRGRSRASQGENVAMRYVQLEDGEIIDGYRATEIRRFAQSIFVGFTQKGKLFPSWMEGTDAETRTDYYCQMTARFIELGLCDLDWKSEQVAIDTYPQWHSSWVKRLNKPSSKRPAEEHNDSLQKKPRTLDNTCAPLPLERSPMGSSIPLPHINVIPDTPARSAQATGHITIGNQFIGMNMTTRTSSDTRPPYQFSINKPFAPSPLASSSLSPTHSFSNQVHLNPDALSPQPVVNMPEGSDQRTSKQPGKMRFNRHSITARNLCAKEWIEKNSNGTTQEFAAYFSALSEKELQHFKDLSQSLAQGKSS